MTCLSEIKSHLKVRCLKIVFKIFYLIIFVSTVLCRYYHNITSNTLVVLEAIASHGVKTLIYSSTCATYGEPEKMPITEQTPQVPQLSEFHSCIFLI